MTDDELPRWLIAAEPLSQLQIEAVTDNSLAVAVINEADMEAAKRWSITGTESGEWAMQKFADAAHAVTLVEEQARAWIARITAWRDETTRRDVQTMRFFEGLLQRYAIEERERTGGKVKTVKLPSGDIATRESSTGLHVHDERAATEWLAAEAPNLLRMTVNTSALKSSVTIEDVPSVILLTCGHEARAQQLSAHYGIDPRKLERGSAWPCPTCGEEGLIGDWTQTEQVVTLNGHTIPGVSAKRPEIHATVKTR
jgi:predicted RNA-binding Zn-ribbon protein involved in translation (DUF1610 family)